MPAVIRRFPNFWIAVVAIAAVAIFASVANPLSNITDNAIIACAYVMMALGLNIVVGFAGLLDLGYVAFYAFGAYAIGWLSSDFFTAIATKGVHVGAGSFASTIPGYHFNFLLVLVVAVIVAAVAGTIIGLPTLRLRGDYIAIVTLAFGEIIYRFAKNGDTINPTSLLHTITFGLIDKTPEVKLTNGVQSISPVDQITLPFFGTFNSALDLRPYLYLGLVLVAIVLFIVFRLRSSRLGRAWVAVREDEVAAASMGVPLVKTKLLAYATGGAIGGAAGSFLGAYYNSVNANSFQFGFSIFILSMIIIGGLGSIWGVVVGAIVLSFINTYFLPGPFTDLFGPGGTIDLGFDPNSVKFGIFGLLIVLMMILRPGGLVPERRRKMELTEDVSSGESVYELRA